MANTSPEVTPGMLCVSLFIVTFSLILVYLWVDFIYALFYTTLCMDKDSVYDTFLIAMAFTLFFIFIVIVADENCDWDGWDTGGETMTQLQTVKDKIDKLQGILNHSVGITSE